jgi:hypothetical protein
MSACRPHAWILTLRRDPGAPKSPLSQRALVVLVHIWCRVPPVGRHAPRSWRIETPHSPAQARSNSRREFRTRPCCQRTAGSGPLSGALPVRTSPSGQGRNQEAPGPARGRRRGISVGWPVVVDGLTTTHQSRDSGPSREAGVDRAPHRGHGVVPIRESFGARPWRTAPTSPRSSLERR